MPADSSPEKPAPRPSTLLLILINGGIFYGLILLGGSLINLVVGLFVTARFMTVSAFWHALLVFLLERNRPLHPAVRTVLFLVPVLVVMSLPLVGLRMPGKLNKQPVALSQRGDYRSEVTAENGRWNVRIVDQHGRELLDEETNFVSHIHVFWMWGEADRLWLYNSGDGTVYFWQEIGGAGWRRTKWGYEKTQIGEALPFGPPPELYPDYKKKRKKQAEES